jgi:hypothetical protein
MSSGQVCNNHQSGVSDDDGGYLRMAATAYFKNPVALGPLPHGQVAAPAAPTPAPEPVATPTPGPTIRAELLGGTIDPTVASAGDSVMMRQDVLTNADGVLLVDFEVYDGSGNRVWQAYQDNQAFSAGLPGSASATLQVPDSLPVGTYLVKTGVFGAGWGPMYAWNDQAGILTIAPPQEASE